MFALYIISNEVTKKQRFLATLNKDIALCILRATHHTYQSTKDAALKVEI